MAAPLADYSALERLLHRVAFASPRVQLAVSELEDTLFGGSYRDAPARRPVFITSLPRAGTTMLLDALHRIPTIAVHTYRDMPFVLAPVLWNRLSAGFRRQATARERAHGDGIEIGFDSPEAFEEIFWRAFWPQKYRGASIALWTERDHNGEAVDFLRNHFRKIISLRAGAWAAEARYVSKNNANIGRIDFLAAAMPDAQIVVPIRCPLDHAASLLRQHRNFLTLHARDAFTRRYMADIGHLEFGQLHKPIGFPGVAEFAASASPDSIDYWLRYWLCAFEYTRARRDRIIVISYEEICRDPPGTLGRLCERLGIRRDAVPRDIGTGYRASTRHEDASLEASAELAHRARELHAELLQSRSD